MEKHAKQYFRRASHYTCIFSMACARACNCDRTPFLSWSEMIKLDQYETLNEHIARSSYVNKVDNRKSIIEQNFSIKSKPVRFQQDRKKIKRAGDTIFGANYTPNIPNTYLIYT